MDNVQIAYLITFLIGMIALVTPIIKLNTTITKLDITLNNLIKRTDEDRSKLEKLETELYKKGV